MRLVLSDEKLDVIGAKLDVRASESQAFTTGLGDQHAIKRVAVIQRQRCCYRRMSQGDRQGPTAGIQRNLEQIVTSSFPMARLIPISQTLTEDRYTSP